MSNDTVEIWWALPNGGTPEAVTYPQTQVDPSAVPCDTWIQIDTYTVDEAAIFTADGFLTQGEDYHTDTQQGAISWHFEIYGGECVPVIPPDDACPEIDGFQAPGDACIVPTPTPTPTTEAPVPPVDTYVPPAVVPNAPPVTDASVVVPVSNAPMLAETGVDFSPLIFTAAITLVLLGVLAWSMGRDRRAKK